MKKYLMTGVAALAMCATFTSCSHDEVSQLSQPEIDKMNYDNAFLTYVGGKIANDHDWGFSATRGITRVSSPNDADGNGAWEMCTPISDSERTKVINHFKDPANYKTVQTPAYENFWVQQVYKGEQTYDETVGNGNKQSAGKGSDHMDYLQVRESTGWVDVERFNNANGGGTNRMLMVNSSTQNFRYKNSLGGANQFNENAYLVQEIDGAFYVGFDYRSDDPQHKVAADGVYNDWIVKIAPAKKKILVGDIRIIAEDLSASGDTDFDFNDIVLDIKFGNPATLILQAAGGTLPLRIAGNDNWETHKLFEVWRGDLDTKQVMVNTGAGPDKDPVVIEGFTSAIWSAADAKNLILQVYKNGSWQTLTAERGEPAAKLCVDPSFGWLAEKVSIKGEYDTFLLWVENGTNGFKSKWWE